MHDKSRAKKGLNQITEDITTINMDRTVNLTDNHKNAYLILT